MILSLCGSDAFYSLDATLGYDWALGGCSRSSGQLAGERESVGDRAHHADEP
jgi:hypothetical protein